MPNCISTDALVLFDFHEHVIRLQQRTSNEAFRTHFPPFLVCHSYLTEIEGPLPPSPLPVARSCNEVAIRELGVLSLRRQRAVRPQLGDRAARQSSRTCPT